MNVRPIIFSGPMVRALLEGRKTMTRRWAWQKCKKCKGEGACWHEGPATKHTIYGKCPKCLGARMVPSPWQKVQPGDLLHVREAFCQPNDQVVIYRANWREDALARGLDNVPDTDVRIRWKPSIHMPRWASRLTLEVTATKIERLQDISKDDALAEGVYPNEQPPATFDRTYGDSMPVHLFGGLWDHLHGPDAWDANPEVVALTFKVHKQNVDALLAEREAA